MGTNISILKRIASLFTAAALVALGGCRSEPKITRIGLLRPRTAPVSIITGTCAGESITRVAVVEADSAAPVGEAVRWEIRAEEPSTFSGAGYSSGHIFDSDSIPPPFHLTQAPRLDLPDDTPLLAIIETTRSPGRYSIRFRLRDLKGIGENHVLTSSDPRTITPMHEFNNHSTPDCDLQ